MEKWGPAACRGTKAEHEELARDLKAMCKTSVAADRERCAKLVLDHVEPKLVAQIVAGAIRSGAQKIEVY
jgi:hypothetical protein